MDNNRGYTIKELPSDERPRERLIQNGATYLSNSELIAIALRTGGAGQNVMGLADALLARFGGLAELAQASSTELCEVPGIGPAKAAQLLAAFEMGRRMVMINNDGRTRISSPDDVARFLMASMAGLQQEELHVLMLDVKNYVRKHARIYRGNTSSASIRAGEVFREAVRDNATSVIIAHNHPSGDPTPSADDIAVTRDLVQAGKLLDIQVLDHLIIGSGRWASLKSMGLGGL